MLLITPRRNVERGKRYFTQKANDHEYLSEHDTGIGTWGGRRAARLSLSGSIHPEHFAALCDNAHPLSGEEVAARLREKCRTGYDLTFDMPKGVSVGGVPCSMRRAG